MRWLLLILLLLTGGCMPGDHPPQAATRFEFSSTADLDAATRAVRARLIELGFETAPDEPVPDFTLRGVSAGHQWRMINAAHFWRDRGDLLDRESLSIQLTPYPEDSVPYEPFTGYVEAPRHPPFLELHFSQARPDGFGAEALALYADIVQFISEQNAKPIPLALSPRGDDQAWFNYQLTSLLMAIAGWLIAWIIFVTIIGGFASWLFAQFFDWSLPIRRLAFVLVGALLATPIPVPTTLITLPLPNVLALWPPSVYAELLANYGLLIAILMIVSAALSALTALVFIRSHSN